jgi:multidrug resistance efflux pump
LTRKQTELTINQQIEQAKNALDTAKEALWNAEKGAELAIQQAKIGVTNANNQIDTLKTSFISQKSTIINVINGVLDTADTLLGVTDYYEDKLNKSMDVYLGAKDVRLKNQAKDELKALYTLRDEIKNLKDVPETNEELLTNTLQLEEGYQKTFSFAKTMEQIMENSIASQGSLDQTQIDTYKTSFQNIQYGATTNSSRTQLITYLSNVNSQLNNSGTISQESADITLKNAALSAKNNLFQAETAVKNAETAYNTVTENKDIQLQLLSNAISDARLAYERALTQYNRLQISSPIDGVIEQIMVTEGQEI